MAPVDHNTQSIEGPVATQQTSADSKKNSNLISTRQNSRMVHNDIGIEVAAPNRILWILKRFLWSIPNKTIAIVAFFLFIGITMAIGILIVCFRSPKPQSGPCQINFERSAHRAMGYDSRPLYLAAGDFNNDGYQDIAVANSGTDNVGIFLGYGNGTFAAQVSYATGLMSRPYSVAIGDFNKDSNPDIAVANYGSNRIGVLFGDGNGHFASPIITSLGSSRPLLLFVKDFNKDNQLDIAVVSYGTSTVAVLTGYNNGSFGIKTIHYMGHDSNPYSLAVGDFNNDTQLDIAVVNYGTSTLAILLATESGNFTSQEYTTGNGSHPCSVAIGDFNKDNRLDIAVVNSGTSNAGIFLGYGNGNFTNIMIQSIDSDSNPQFIIVDDLNNDTILDIVIVSAGDGSAGDGSAGDDSAGDDSAGDGSAGEGSAIVLEGNGNGGFSLATTYPIGLNFDPCSIAVADFDNDKKRDIAITNNGTNSIVILIGYSHYPVTNQTPYSTGPNSAPTSVAVGDLNNDNRLDIVVGNSGINYSGIGNSGTNYIDVGNSGTNDIGVFINNGDGSFISGQVYNTSQASTEQVVSIGDFNNDNQLDIAVATTGVNKIVILLGYGNGTFRYGKTFSTGEASLTTSITVGDFNKDSYLDIATVTETTNYVGIFMGYGDGTFKDVIRFPIRNEFTSLSVNLGDFNSDNILDIVTGDFKNSYIFILQGYGNGSFLISTVISTDADLPSCFAVGDLNNDHRLDIVYSSPTTSVIGVLLGYGNGTFASIAKYSTGTISGTFFVVLGDFNNDTLPDIVVSNAANDNIGMFVGYGNGSFAAQTTFSTGFLSFPLFLAVGDFNNDKRSDIAVANSLMNNIGVFLVYDGANFSSASSYTTGSGPHPYSVAVGDFNNDRQSDIVVANSGNDNIQILLSYDKGTFMNTVTYSIGFHSNPRFVTIADFNNDKKLDIAVADVSIDAITTFIGFGNGTFDRATTYSTGVGSSPNSIAVGDFDNNTRKDIVVANSGIDNIAVFLAFDYVTFTNYSLYIPALFSIPTYVVVGDFNNDHKCDIIVANGLSGDIDVYLGYGNRTFARPISHSTSASSLSLSSLPASIAVGDFNNDNISDIVVANRGTNNIGVFLGYGNGSFETQIEYETGNSSTPVSVAIGDFNNDNISDIVVANRGTNNIGLFIGYGNGTFAQQIPNNMSDGSSPVWVVVDDMDNDDILDIIVANNNTNNIAILFGYGNGTFYEQIVYSSETNAVSVAVGDFNKDDWTDIASIDQGTGAIIVHSSHDNGTGFLESDYSPSLQSIFLSIFVEDVNNDTNLDILVTSINENIGMVYILFGFGDGNFTAPTVYSIGPYSTPNSIGICDFDNDGRVDLAVINLKKKSIFFMFQYGTEQFASSWIFTTDDDSHPRSVTVGDFDNDNHQDIAVANSGNDNIGIFRGKGNGKFSDQETYPTGDDSRPNAIAVGDFNNDTQLDIAVANSGANNISIFLGYKNGTFAVITTYPTGANSTPSSIAIDDLNKDNHMDIVVVTSGINKVLAFFGLGNGTFLDPKIYFLDYNANPQSVTIGDMNNDGLLDIIVANAGADYIEILLQTC